MTKQEAIDRLISWANAQIGTHEGPNNWNPYAETEGLRTLYGWNIQGQPWCDVFVDAGFISLFGYDLGSAMTYQFAGCAGAACGCCISAIALPWSSSTPSPTAPAGLYF